VEPRRFFHHAVLVPLLWIACAGVPVNAGAQQNARVLCDALVGFNGVAREGRFSPVILSVENPGARMTAEISLTVTWGALREPLPGRTITREAVLDEGATRRFSFVVPLPRSVRSVHASVTSRGAEVGSPDVDTRSLTTPSRLIAGISSDYSLDSLSALGGRDDTLRVVYPRVDDLPQAWAGYDGVDAVIVHDTYFRQLRADQVEALEHWVAGGGVLVFTGGAAALQLESAGFRGLLPVEVSGLARREGVSLRAGAGAPRRLPGRIELAEARAVRGAVLAADGALPLIVRRSLGRGTVWFLAFDPTAVPLRSWEGTPALWRSILEGGRVSAMGAASKPAVEDPWISAALTAAPLSFPRVSFVLLFVGAYLALLFPVLLVRRGDRVKPRTRLLLLFGVCASAAVVGWFLFNSVLFRAGVQTVDAARVESRSGDGLAFVTEKIALFATSAQPVEGRFGDAALEAGGLWTRQNVRPQEPHLLLRQEGSRVQVHGIDMDRLGARLLAVQDVVPFSVTARVRSDGSSLQVFARNGTGRTLQGCFMLASGRVFPLGDIAAGASVQKSYAASDGLKPSGDSGVLSGMDNRQAALFKAQEGEEPPAGPARLIGWIDGPVLPVSFPGSYPLGGVPGPALMSVEAE